MYAETFIQLHANATIHLDAPFGCTHKHVSGESTPVHSTGSQLEMSKWTLEMAKTHSDAEPNTQGSEQWVWQTDSVPGYIPRLLGTC